MTPEMLTIGAFAKACRLSPQALRLYDELNLLCPARVVPDTGYRYYAPAPALLTSDAPVPAVAPCVDRERFFRQLMVYGGIVVAGDPSSRCPLNR